MTALPKSAIKAYFQTGDKPTASNFSDLVDSYADVGSVLTVLTGDVTITTPVSGSAIATISSAAVSLTSKVSGILPVANGGTGTATGVGYKGAVATASASQAIPSGTFTAVIFDTTYIDTYGTIHSTVTNPSRLTVPTGVTRARFIGRTELGTTSSMTFDGRLALYKNGSLLSAPLIQDRKDTTTASTINLSIVSVALNVAAADYFEVFVIQNNSTSLSLTASETMFELQVLT